MAKHRRPTRVQQARATTLKTAAALGVAGALALALHSTVGDDKPAQARSGTNAEQQQPQQLPDSEPTATEEPTTAGLSPTASKEPKLLEERSQDAIRTSRTEARTPDSATTAAAAPTATPTSAPTSDAAAQPANPAPTKSSSPESTPTTEPADSTAPTDQPSEQPSDGGDQGLVGGVIGGVGGAVGGLLR
ncbi:extensin [Streptomyces sp. 8N616]|uniref:extensin n=1 Tax=Streptomyces sp. 8N616 TaxID=3457414 RepID=UPI003FD2CA60